MKAPIKLKRSTLLDMVWSRPISAVAAELDLSPNGLAKICDRLEIERPPKGYWRSKSRAAAIDKPATLANPDGIITIGGEPSGDRRQRSRMPAEDRRRLMLDCARQIATESGLHEVSLKAIARRLGMSEAQAHNIFSTRNDLLVELAFEEVQAFEASRLKAVERGGGRLAKVVLSSITYLREVSRRGPLLQQILRDSQVRRRIDQLRQEMRAKASQKHVQAVIRDKNVNAAEALASVSIMSALVVRAGELVSEGQLTIEEAERLCIPIVIASAERGSSETPLAD